jgi:hypothetical protein
MLGVRRGEAIGSGFIVAQASTMKETNQTPPWIQFTEDQRDARED